MSKTITSYTTGSADILFMAAARPLTNKGTGKEEYSIKLAIDSATAEGKAVSSLLFDIAEYKIDTKTNRGLQRKGELSADYSSGKFVVSFISNYAPVVTDWEGNTLEGSSVPFFDGRKDTGTANVTFKVIDYGDNKIVRLHGIQLMKLNLAPREEIASETSVDGLRSKLKALDS